MGKRFLDFVCSAGGLLFFAPLLLCLIFLIKIDSPGPILYRGLRVGRDGKLFYILKLRTMVWNAERIGGPSTANGDGRVTRFGRLIRKFKFDEIPQFWNILVGQMSFIGPRPDVPQYIALLGEEEKRIILSIRPGMTDYATLWNYDEGAALEGAADPEKTYLEKIRPTKVRLQIKYVKEHNLLIDAKIFLRHSWRILRSFLEMLHILTPSKKILEPPNLIYENVESDG